MTVASVSGLYLPAVFAAGTGLPVLVAAWILAFTVAGIGNFYRNIRTFETWFRRFVAAVFISTGLYYLYIIFVN